MELQKARIDKWLWSIRMFKTRSLSTDVCKAGRVKINGKSVKPSYQLVIGETVTFIKNGDIKIVKVLALVEKRVGAVIAQSCYEDLSPPPEAKQNYTGFPVKRDRGAGRPTKRERRKLDDFREED